MFCRVSETKGLLVIQSFSLGTEISYVVTVVNDTSGPYVDSVSGPTIPAG